MRKRKDYRDGRNDLMVNKRQRRRNTRKRGVFPDGVTRQDVIEAIAKFDGGTRHDFAESTHYDLLLPDGRRYPPKAIAGIASTRVAGRILKPEHFSAGEGQKCFRILRENGFQIVPKLKGNEVKPMRNPPWKREELLLALELYLRNRKSPPSKTSKEVESLSKELNQLRARIGRRGSASFRNAAGVYLKMMNFRSYDPEYTSQGKVGMRHGNKLDSVVWNEFFGKEKELFNACRRIRERLNELPEREERSVKLAAIASKLNELSPSHPIGKLQVIRTQLKNLKHRPGDKIFSSQTTFKDWAFHHGGRTELQFNIGYEDEDGRDDLRHGVAFSFELSQTLKSIDVLIPKVKFFNDFVQLNADELSDMRMWHYDSGRRSIDRPPQPIPSALVKKDVFVFVGKRQPAKAIDYENILDDFDRLLPLYRYVESGGTTAPLPLPKTGFNFKARRFKKVTTAKATLREQNLDLDLRHNVLQEVLYRRLVSDYGKDNVSAEQPSGVGTMIDIVVKVKEEYWFYEIKTALTPRACLREAIGQLLEYGFWPGAQEPTRFIVVGESVIDKEGHEYLRRLRERYSLRIEYQTAII
jgi:hypothetical protein